MRKLLLLVLSVAMIAGGLYWLAAELLFSDTVYYQFVVGGVALVMLGAYLLWADFAAPLLGIKTWEDE
jgi:hypothetical protein